MFNSWIHPKAHLFLHIVGMTLIAIGLPLNKVVMSVGTIWIIANWLIELDFRKKLERFKENKLLWLVLSIFFLHVIGLLWTNDLSYGFRDIEKKLPLFVLPLVCGTREQLKKDHYWIILYGFIVSLLITSLINFSQSYFGEQVKNYREISLFGSHIRYALLVNFAVFISLFTLIKKKLPRLVGGVLLIWFVYYIFYSQVSSGILLLVILSVTSGLYFIFTLRKRWLNWTLSLFLIFGLTYLSFTAVTIWNDVQPKEDETIQLPALTSRGNPYSHLTSYKFYECGHQLLTYVNEPEMELEWSKLSKVPFEKEIKKGYVLKHRLIKYLSSKGYRKDGDGVLKLTKLDVKNLENGIGSIVELKNPLERKLYQFFGQYKLYQNNSDPNGLSYLQRIEHMKTGWLIFKEHPVIGVGTGDVQTSFDEMYLQESSNLDEDHRLRAHSQVLTFMITFGFFGGVLLLMVLIFPLVNSKGNYLQVIFIISIMCSFAFSDLLETQVGVTFFALFYALHSLSNKGKALE
jgi:hypothetical protein